MECKNTRDALNVAVAMLEVIQRGGSFTTEAWFERMNAIKPWAIDRAALGRMERRISRKLLPGKDVS